MSKRMMVTLNQVHMSNAGTAPNTQLIALPTQRIAKCEKVDTRAAQIIGVAGAETRLQLRQPEDCIYVRESLAEVLEKIEA